MKRLAGLDWILFWDVRSLFHGLQTRSSLARTPFNPPSPDPQPDTADISALVNKFKSTIGAPIKARALLVDPVPDMESDLGFAHISACVDAFKGLPYPHTIASCP